MSSLQFKLKTLYRAQDTIPKLLEIDDDKLEQSWDKYYIRLQVVPKLNSSNEFERCNVDVEKVFDRMKNDDREAGKILLLGVGGAGKTTLLHYICYKWATGKLWNDRFDRIYRIRLKTLMNRYWDKDYTPDQRKNLLSCLIHRSLKLQTIESAENLKDVGFELSELVVDERTLVLLDGYNEIELLVRDSERRDEYSCLMTEIFNVRSLIMSSRYNALDFKIQDRFERIVENRGLDYEHVARYIDVCFSRDNLGMSLKSYLERNPNVKSLCELPINIVLICLIWRDPAVRQRFSNSTEFNAGILYREVLIWLGTRYLDKFEQRDPNNVTRSNVLDCALVKFLRKVAYKSFNQYGNFVSKDIILNNLEDLDMTKVYKFGLLRAEGDATKIVDLNYQFIHPTIQEYLMADYMENLIDAEPMETCTLIGRHRNEPKYLPVLKFLVGILSHESQTGPASIVRFWEAVTCNVDGILELGADAKISLAMHLLEQAKIDRRIPNLPELMHLIDDSVSDFVFWRNDIVQSGFMSPKLAEILIGTLNVRDDISRLRTALEIMANLVDKAAFGGRSSVFDRLIELLDEQNWLLNMLGLEKLNAIIDATIHEDILIRNFAKICTFVGNGNMSAYAGDVVVKSALICPELYCKFVEFIKKTVESPRSAPECKSACVGLVLKFFNTLTDYEDRKLDDLLELLKFCADHKLYDALRDMTSIVEILPHDRTDIVAEKTMNIFTELEANHTGNKLMISAINEQIPRILQAISADKLTEISPNVLRNTVRIVEHYCRDRDWDLWIHVVSIFKKLQELTGSGVSEVLFETLDRLMDLKVALNLSRMKEALNVEHRAILAMKAYRILSENIDDCVSTITEIPDVVEMLSTRQEVAVQAFYAFMDNDRFINDNNYACMANNNMIKLLKFMREDQASTAVDKLLTVLKTALESPGLSGLKLAALSDLKSLLKAMDPNRAKTAALILLPCYNKIFGDTRNMHVLSISAMDSSIEMLQFIDDDRKVAEVLELLKSVIGNTRAHVDLRIKAMNSLKKLSKNNSFEGTVKAFNLLCSVVTSQNMDVHIKFRAAEVIPDFFDLITPKQADEFIEALIKLSRTDLSNVGIGFKIIMYNIAYIARLSIPKHRNLDSETVDKALNMMRDMIRDPRIDERYQEEISCCFAVVLKAKDFSFITELLNDGSPMIRKATRDGIYLKLMDQDASLDYREIVGILSVVDSGAVTDKPEKKLLKAVNDGLSRLIGNIDEEGIAWISGRFNVLAGSAEMKTFLKGLYREVLKRIDAQNEMNDVNKAFIIQCLNYGFTTVFMSSDDGDKVRYYLTFEDITCSVLDTNNVEDVVMVGVEQDNDLAKQYVNYEPMFRNTGSALKIAAVDVRAESILNDGSDLSMKSWKLTWLCLSDHNKSTPVKSFLLIERRDPFGYHLIYRAEKSDVLRLCNYAEHPADISGEIRRQIFGDLKYGTIKPRYYCWTRCISLEEGKSLIRKLYSSNDADLSLERLLESVIGDAVSPWDEFVRRDDVVEMKKVTVLKLNDSEAESARRDSLIVDNSENINNHSETLGEITNTIEKLRDHVAQDEKIKQRDKNIILEKIEHIKRECARIGDNADVSPILVELKQILMDQKITKGRISDLEDLIDEIKEGIE